MTTETQPTRRIPRRRVLSLGRIALLVCLVGPLLVACGAAEATPVVYTAPPEVLDAITFRTPAPSPSAAPGIVPGASASNPSANPGGSQAIAQPDPGRIVFGTGAGPNLCSVVNPSTVLPAIGPFFFAARLKDRMDGTQAIQLKVERDGTVIVDHTEPADGSAYDCYGNREGLASMQPGEYRFTVLRDTTVEADGAVTVR